MEHLTHSLDTAKTCCVCTKTIRRRQPAVNARCGWCCPGCADDPKANAVPAPTRSAPRARRRPRVNLHADPKYVSARRALFAEARRYGAWGCYWCGRDTSEHLHRDDPLKAVADHVVPIARDPDHLSLVVSCRDCNGSRGDSGGRPKWLEGWTPGTPLPMPPSQRRALERARARMPQQVPHWFEREGDR